MTNKLESGGSLICQSGTLKNDNPLCKYLDFKVYQRHIHINKISKTIFCVMQNSKYLNQFYLIFFLQKQATKYTLYFPFSCYTPASFFCVWVSPPWCIDSFSHKKRNHGKDNSIRKQIIFLNNNWVTGFHKKKTTFKKWKSRTL